MKVRIVGAGCVLGVCLIAINIGHAAEMGTAFTYQGTLENAGGPVTDSCDFEFSLWDASTDGSQQGSSPDVANGVAVENGLFTVEVDFVAAAFTGDARWLEMAVCCPTGTRSTWIPNCSRRV